MLPLIALLFVCVTSKTKAHNCSVFVLRKFACSKDKREKYFFRDQDSRSILHAFSFDSRCTFIVLHNEGSLMVNVISLSIPQKVKELLKLWPSVMGNPCYIFCLVLVLWLVLLSVSVTELGAPINELSLVMLRSSTASLIFLSPLLCSRLIHQWLWSVIII